jgi:tetratricopeptide (TPR) repeat protein
MYKVTLFIFTFSMIYLIISSGYGQQTADQLFQAGLYEEEVKGEMEKAIEVYQIIVEKYSANRPIAAKALFHIGLCYEKLGKQEAQKAYQRIIREFADQNEVVAEALTRLAALEKPVGPSVAKGIVVRQVWSGPDVDTYGAPSPDGRYLSYTDWETGDLAIRELATGKTRRLTKKGTQKKEPLLFALNSVISPDNKLVAYSWTNEYGTYDLCLIGIDGSGNRILYNSKDKDEVYPASWSSQKIRWRKG